MVDGPDISRSAAGFPIESSRGGAPEEVVALLRQVKADAQGMLPLEVYERLYLAAGEAGGGTFVEIGTAQGAATIALALGAKAAGKPFRLWTVDPFDRGTRLAVGSVAENVALVRSGYERFGVAEDIEVVVGETSDLIGALDSTDIQLLLIDADGRFDRDLGLLFDRLSSHASIIVDDLANQAFAWFEGGRWWVGQKHRLSFLLARAFSQSGHLLPEQQVLQTGFFRKGEASFDQARFDAVALSAYRELVNTVVEHGQIGMRPMLRQIIEQRVPALLQLYRRIRYGATPEACSK